jgi:putative endonuclease
MDFDILSANQQRRIKAAAELFLFKNPKYHNYNIRFDFVFIRPYCMPIIITNYLA